MRASGVGDGHRERYRQGGGEEHGGGYRPPVRRE